MTNSTFICIDADKGGIIQIPEEYTIWNRLKWKTFEIITSIKTKWVW